MITKCKVCEQRKKEEQNEGFSNKETWAVALHLDNHKWMQNKYAYLRMKTEGFPLLFQEAVKKLVEEWFGDFYSDTMGHYTHERLVNIRLMAHDVGSLWRVNWKELAEHLLKD